MTRNHTRGILAIGIICLFVGVGIHPAFAVDTNQSMVNKASEDDCGCNEVDDRQLVVLERQLNNVYLDSENETICNILISIFLVVWGYANILLMIRSRLASLGLKYGILYTIIENH